MTPERFYKAYNLIKELRPGEIVGRLLAIPALIAMTNMLDEEINVQQKALEVWQQPKSGIIFQANDAFLPPEDINTASISEYNETSEFMIGRVAVNIILPESDGSVDPSTEDWTDEEQDHVFSEIVAAMDWWAAREPRANLTYIYDVKTLPTSYEPINHPFEEQGLWIEQIMAELGYNSSSYFTRVRDYNNALRSQYNTDWAFTIFVVDSSEDNDNKFPDGKFTYAYLGGPYMVMTYGNEDYGPDNMDVVTAHEVGHIFYALDQYPSAGMLCTNRSGYLRVENQNIENGDCSSNEPSIMRGWASPYLNGALDKYARGQVGWWDLDRDNILDPVDPEVMGTFLYPYSPDPINNDPISYRGLAIATAGVTSVEYRVGTTGIWQSTNPVDGAFNGVIEPFQFTAPGASRERLVLQILLTDSKGISQVESYSSNELIVRRPTTIWLPIIVNGSPKAP